MFNKVIISENKLIKNIKEVKARSENSKLCVMVKSNAYGVGVEDVVKIVDDYVDFYGVAFQLEAKKLKK